MTLQSQLILLLLTTVIFDRITECSYCGQAAIPFSLQVLSNGQPVLGCARPSCFGWSIDNNTQSKSEAFFYRIHHKNDGFMRKSDVNKSNNYGKLDRTTAQLALCEKDYKSTECDENLQWVGGIVPMSNFLSKPLLLRCCTYKLLADSWDQGVADIGPGQIVIGGEVMHNERQYAFEYIANVWRQNTANGSVAFSVAMRRFQCIPFPDHHSVRSSESTQQYIIELLNDVQKAEKFDGSAEKKLFASQQLKAPDQTSASSATFSLPVLPTQIKLTRSSDQQQQNKADQGSADSTQFPSLLNSLPLQPLPQAIPAGQLGSVSAIFEQLEQQQQQQQVHQQQQQQQLQQLLLQQQQQQKQQQQQLQQQTEQRQQYPALASLSQLLGLPELPTLPPLPNIFG